MDTVDLLLSQLRTDAPAAQVLVGAFSTVVVLDTVPPRCGLASTTLSAAHHESPSIPAAGQLEGRSGRELAAWLRSDDPLQASVGMAAYNALLEVDEAACLELNAEEIILQRGAGRSVAVVGHFPFVERVRQAARICWVLELRPRSGDLAADRAGEVLPQADVVAITGTSLINHTFDGLMELCQPDAFVLVLGASAPLTPALFERGVDAICGTRVVDIPAVMRAAAQGATFRQIPGKRLLTMVK